MLDLFSLYCHQRKLVNTVSANASYAKVLHVSFQAVARALRVSGFKVCQS